MNEKLVRVLIKKIFDGKIFPIMVILYIKKISNLEFNTIYRDTSSGSNIIKFTYKNEWLEIAVPDTENDIDYGSNISIWACSIDKIREDLEMKGSFFRHDSNFDFNSVKEIKSLEVNLAKFEKLC